jgi:hypothetical protein
LNLFKKYDYLSTELEFKNEISNISRLNFFENLQKVVNSNEELKEIYEDTFEIKSKSEQVNETEADTNSIIENTDTTPVDDYLKKLYRQIAKLTHPDNIKNSYLNSLYLQATHAMKFHDSLNIFRICILLEIDFEISDNLANEIHDEIESLQKRIAFIDTSYHMRWHNSDKKDKMQIIFDYMKRHLKLCEV